MKTEQLYKFVPIEEAKDLLNDNVYYTYCDDDGVTGYQVGRRVKTAPYCNSVLLPFHPSPKEISEEEAKKLFLNNIQEFLNNEMYSYPEHKGEAQAIHHAVETLRELVPDKLFSLPSSGSKTEVNYAPEFLNWTDGRFVAHPTWAEMWIRVEDKAKDKPECFNAEEVYEKYLTDINK